MDDIRSSRLSGFIIPPHFALRTPQFSQLIRKKDYCLATLERMYGDVP